MEEISKSEKLKASIFGHNHQIIDPKVSRQKRNRNLIHFASLIIFSQTIFWVIFFWLKGFLIQGISLFFLLFFLFLAIYLLKKGYVESAKVILFISGLVLMWQMFLFVEGLGMREAGNANHFYCLVMISAISFLFIESNIFVRFLFLILSSGTFVMVQFEIIHHQPYFFISDEIHLLGRQFVLVVAYIFLAGLTHLFVSNIMETEKLLFKTTDMQEKILEKILPKGIAARIRSEGRGFINRHPECSVLFADIVGFTHLSETMAPDKLVSFLNEIFSRFDDLTERLDLQKIKTIGDAYMVASYSEIHGPEHAEKMVMLSLAFFEVIKEYKDISIRIGINSGIMIEGVIGEKKFTYDLWGGAVNIASKMESQGVPGALQITKNTYALLKNKQDFIETKVCLSDTDECIAYLLIL